MPNKIKNPNFFLFPQRIDDSPLDLREMTTIDIARLRIIFIKILKAKQDKFIANSLFLYLYIYISLYICVIIMKSELKIKLGQCAITVYNYKRKFEGIYIRMA